MRSYCSASEANEEGGSFCSDSLALSLPSEPLVGGHLNNLSRDFSGLPPGEPLFLHSEPSKALPHANRRHLNGGSSPRYDVPVVVCALCA